MSEDRSDEMFDWYAEDDEFAATTWEPADLGPYLRGEIQPVTPTVGVHRSDGQQMLYPGLEHAVIAHTATGKTWFALASVTAELLNNNPVVYLHFEESSPASTVERLQRIGIPTEVIQRRLLFAAPSRPVRHGWLDSLLAARPPLVIIDGVNEAMILHGQKIDLEGWSAVRRQIIVPFKEAGAAVLECDHLPLSADPLRGDAYGTVHKGNVIDGARFALVREQQFGRGKRGVSHVYVTKDRPGYLAAAGREHKSGFTYIGTFVADDSSTQGADFLTLWAPKSEGEAQPAGMTVTTAELADTMLEVIGAQPDRAVPTARQLFALMRIAGHSFRDSAYRRAVDDLVAEKRVEEVPGKRGATGYRVTATTASQGSSS